MLTNSSRVSHRPARSQSATPSKLGIAYKHRLSRLCPLSDESIGIISENDHRVGLCICKYCECGEHICPSKKVDLSLSSAYKTKYNSDYKPYNFDTSIRGYQKVYTPNPFRLETQTTNQNEFKGHKITPKKAFSPPSVAKSLEFMSRSAYNNDFPN